MEKYSGIDKYAQYYIKRLTVILNKIKSSDLVLLENFFLDARQSKKKIFVIGNGGSATTASTMANDLGFDILKKTSNQNPFKIFSLTDNSAVMSAISNDVGYANVFLNQLKIHYDEGDCLIVISASGNSSNLIKAANYVKKRKGKVFGFLGFDGGKLLKICNNKILIKTKKGEYGPVEDSHLIINHILAHWFQILLK